MDEIFRYVMTHRINDLFRELNRGYRYKYQFYANYLNNNFDLIDAIPIIIEFNNQNFHVVPVDITKADIIEQDGHKMYKISIDKIDHPIGVPYVEGMNISEFNSYVVLENDKHYLFSVATDDEEAIHQALTKLTIESLNIDTKDRLLDLISEAITNMIDEEDKKIKDMFDKL